ncbi:MAG TPA: RnfABCDGE type electron transport complex subunit D [Candidatus Faecousia intestinigallinarum]|nr:RnfABCDGE type electron transport complex subunit D [Candidatus Faecousia intestinigallinarum]
MKYFYELTISSSPHAHSPVTTRTIMRDVLIALLPALVGSVYFFGFRALMVTLVSAAACVFFEWGYRKLMHLDSTVYDMSAVVTGVLLAFVCPVTIPYWCILIGDFFAIVIVKQLFGGIGKNFVNPALAARAFLFSWPVVMNTWVKVGFENAAGVLDTADVVTAATPLSAMHQGAMPTDSLLNMFLGNVGGCLGETSTLLLLLGAAYLLLRRVISARIPLAFVGTVALIAVLFPQGNDPLAWMGAQVCAGGVMLGAFFMATDYVTSPVTKWGQVIFGMGCGALTMVIRYFGGYNEGVSYAILVMNACVVLLDKVGLPKKYGAVVKEGTKA